MNFDDIIEEYTNGTSARSLGIKYKIGFFKLLKMLKERGITIRTRSEARKICIRPPMSEEHKRNISKARIAYLAEHPDKVPYRLYHSSNYISYPHKRLMKALTDIGIIDWISEYQVYLYSYDIAFPDLKIDVEIDGNTHKSESVIGIDTRRDEYSKTHGWVVLRFTAFDVKNNLDICVNKIIETIYKLNPLYKPYDKDTWELIKSKLRTYKVHIDPKVCKCCSCEFIPSRKEQVFCSNSCGSIYRNMNICKRPSKDILIDDLINLDTFVKISKKYEVSDKTIRKWVDYHCIDYKALKKSLKTD